MESLADVVNSGGDSIAYANEDLRDSFIAPPTSDKYINTGLSTFHNLDLVNNSTGTYNMVLQANKTAVVSDLSNFNVEATIQVVRVIDGKHYGLISQDGVSLVNHFVDSLFSDIEIMVNRSPISKSPIHRLHYVQISHLVSDKKAVAGTGMSYLGMSDPETNPDKTSVASNPYFASRADRIVSPTPTVVVPATGGNEEFTKNQPYAEIDRTLIKVRDVYVTGNLTTEFNTAKYFLPWNSEIVVTLTKEKDVNLIHVGKTTHGDSGAVPKPGEYRVIIKKLGLTVRNFVLNDSWYKKHLDCYNKGMTTKIFYLRPYTNALCIQSGEQAFRHELGFPGRKLCKMFVVFMSSKRFIGDYSKASNCFTPPPNLRSCQLKLGGQDPIQMDGGLVRSPSNSLYEKLYFDYLHNAQVFDKEMSSNTLTFAHFKSSAFILSLNFVANGTLESTKLPLLKCGTVTLDLEMDAPLTEAWYVFYMGLGLSLMEVAPGMPPKISETMDVGV